MMGNRKNALAELRSKFERKQEKAPREALLEEIRARFEQSISEPEQELDECK